MSALHKIKNAFNKSKASYDLHSGLQSHVGDQLIQLLLAVFHKQNLPRIIDLGCGTGTNTQKLLDKIPVRELHAIDIADDLLKIAQQRLQGKNVHVYAHAFDQPFTVDNAFDIAYSNMALHWSVSFDKTIQSLHSQLNKHGIIVFSVPLTGTLSELQPHFSVNSMAQAAEVTQILNQTGFDVLAEQSEVVTLRFPDTLAALRSLKQVGANTSHTVRDNRLSGKSLLRAVNIQQLTYNIGYFIARKTEHPCHANYTLPAQTQALEKPISA